jgi:hypothetical protein
MDPKRVKLEVYVDLDPVPGAFHSVDSARNVVGDILQNSIPHYNPTVSVGINPGDPDEALLARAIDDWFATESSPDGLAAFVTRVMAGQVSIKEKP